MRHDQLLDTARRIIREEGTDVLSLGYLAEQAGVSKPIAYEHFKTRSGLLIALYKQIDDKQVAALHQALDNTPRRLEHVAGVMSKAYMHCYQNAGSEWHAISAALKGDDEMEQFQQKLIDGYVQTYCDALQPYSDLKRKDLRVRCIAIIGAAEALAREMLRRRLSAAAAASHLCTIIIACMSNVEMASR
jgi:AcrR family transcriptional regulator